MRVLGGDRDEDGLAQTARAVDRNDRLAVHSCDVRDAAAVRAAVARAGAWTSW
jgi:NADP-dependent 3-hydroxy acid dehydrogenase YdfG